MIIQSVRLLTYFKLIVVVCCSMVGPGVLAGPVFQKIVDSDTINPLDPTRQFSLLYPEGFGIQDGVVSFSGFANDPNNPFSGGFGGTYIFENEGDIRSVLNELDPVPGFPGESIQGVSRLFVDQGEVFVGAQTISGISAIYRVDQDGGFENVFDNQSAIVPGSILPFTSVASDFVIQGDTIAFLGSDGIDNHGVYHYSRSTQEIGVFVDIASIAPSEQKPFSQISMGGYDDGQVVFHADIPFGAASRRGIYTANMNGEISTTADFFTPIPEAPSDEFPDFNGISGSPVIEDGIVVFAGGNVTIAGLYQAPAGGGEITTITDTTIGIPGWDELGLGGLFVHDLDQGNIAFVGTRLGRGKALYTYFEGEVIRVLSEGDMLFGREVDVIQSSKHGLDGDQLIFYAAFTDGFEGIFTVTVPAPSSTMALVLLGLCRRRNRCGTDQAL